MSRLTAATVVTVTMIAASFGADLWLDDRDAKRGASGLRSPSSTGPSSCSTTGSPLVLPVPPLAANPQARLLTPLGPAEALRSPRDS